MLILYVAPYAGAWIEIIRLSPRRVLPRSLPTRERGLKSKSVACFFRDFRSLPTRERGLKSEDNVIETEPNRVAPYAGAWIEIYSVSNNRSISQSLPTRERGLKYAAPPE